MNKASKVKELLKKIHHSLDLKDYTLELEKDKNFLSDVNKMINKNDIFKKRNFESIYEFSVYRNFIYSLIRNYKHSYILETGVLHGLTTSWILKAIEDNKKGKLFSIDLPRRDWKDFFPNKPFGPGAESEIEIQNQEPGWAIPINLRNFWNLYLGPSSKFLNEILEKNNIDLFIHDSDHSYEITKFECESVEKKKENIDIVIDDYYTSNFYKDFSENFSRNFFKIDEIDDGLSQVPGCAFFPKLK